MSLSPRSRSLFTYGYTVTDLNSSLDFKASPLDTLPRQARLRTGYYSLTSLLQEIERALTEKDPTHTYTATADRTMNGGTENRITITSSHTFFRILFGTGPRAASSCASLIGFQATDYVGGTSYTGSFSTGSHVISTRAGYSYLPPQAIQKVFGSVNVSASGLKEAVVFRLQQFWQVEFKYEPESAALTSWASLLQWLIQQRRIEFTPDIADPLTYYEGTLERTEDDGKGLGYRLIEMLPDFPREYRTGLMVFRRIV